jgi:hypothetical protein
MDLIKDVEQSKWDQKAYLFIEVLQDVRRVQMYEAVANDCGHLINGRGMGPVRVMDRCESNTATLRYIQKRASPLKWKVLLTSHSRAVNIMWVASRL